MNEFRVSLECPHNKRGKTSQLQDEIDMVMALPFYVDDLLAADIYELRYLRVLSVAKDLLARYNINLCKVGSNSAEIT